MALLESWATATPQPCSYGLTTGVMICRFVKHKHMPPLSLVSIQYHRSSVQSVPQCHSRMNSSKAVKVEGPEGTVKTVHLSASLQLHEDLCFRWPCLRPPRPCDLSRSSPVCCCPFSPPFGSNRCDQQILAIMIHDAASIRSTTGTIGCLSS